MYASPCPFISTLGITARLLLVWAVRWRGRAGGKEDALPLTGTSVPAVTSAHTAAAYCIAVNQQAAPAGGIRHRRSVFPQQHQLLPLTSS